MRSLVRIQVRPPGRRAGAGAGRGSGVCRPDSAAECPPNPVGTFARAQAGVRWSVWLFDNRAGRVAKETGIEIRMPSRKDVGPDRSRSGRGRGGYDDGQVSEEGGIRPAPLGRSAPLFGVKLVRAYGGCLGTNRRRRTWQAAKSVGEWQTRVDPAMSEWGNPS